MGSCTSCRPGSARYGDAAAGSDDGYDGGADDDGAGDYCCC